MTKGNNEPTLQAKLGLKEEGFVLGDSRTGIDAQPAAVRVAPESESLIKRVKGRVSELMTEDESLTEDTAREKAMSELDEEMDTGNRRHPGMDAYLRAMKPVTDSTKLNMNIFDPEQRDVLDKAFKHPGDYVHIDSVDLFVDGEVVQRAGILYLDGEKKSLKFLPLPYNPGQGEIKGPDGKTVNYQDELHKLGFNKSSSLVTDVKRVVCPLYESRAQQAAKKVKEVEGSKFDY
jgi:hypothetical protein